ncbi:MAG: NADH-quinone oxidoreductase subunit NuoG [Burkholderiales bacterium]
MITLEIDGRPIQVAPGAMVIQAANKLGITVPHFCYHKKLSIAANCRMCLVQVEKAPKPLPACATPVAEGMKVYTHSDYAVKAQKGVMEFLLINHPLDCPICDQGGECQLQDLSVGYGGSNSRFDEDKRVVDPKDLGPLISAQEMTRCIHCTRCVRFGEEIAGVKELGMIGRGEHAEIVGFVGNCVDSELSGNMIDVCPVGALTSKPFRYAARTWELSRYESISPHDGLGANLTVQVKQNTVMRILPRENEELNECWLADRDRFSYQGLNSPERLIYPMIKGVGGWREVDWQTALDFTARHIKRIKDLHGAESIGALATPHQTFEELFLLQKLLRGLGSNNIDHRLRQADFSLDGKTSFPWLGMKVAELSLVSSALIIGSTLRKEQPLISQRLRMAVKKGLALNVIHTADDDLLMPVANKAITAPSEMLRTLSEVLKAALERNPGEVPRSLISVLAAVQVSESARKMAHSLFDNGNGAILLGSFAQHHPAYAGLYAVAHTLAHVVNARFGVLGEAANSVGASLAGAVPYAGPLGATSQGGLNAAQMLASPRQAYVLLGAEPELDCHYPVTAMKAMGAAEFVVALTGYRHRASDYAHVLLPIAPFTETAGVFINMEGRVQSFQAVVKPLGEARPAWKVLRVLANLLGLPGFEFDDIDAVRNGIDPDLAGAVPRLLNAGATQATIDIALPPLKNGPERIGEVPIYQLDAVVRRAESLQKTRDAAAPTAAMNSHMLGKHKLQQGTSVRVKQGASAIVLNASCDDALPDNAVRIAAGHPLTAGLESMSGAIQLEPVGL